MCVLPEGSSFVFKENPVLKEGPFLDVLNAAAAVRLVYCLMIKSLFPKSQV